MSKEYKHSDIEFRINGKPIDGLSVKNSDITTTTNEDFYPEFYKLYPESPMSFKHRMDAILDKQYKNKE